jgi:hypothetical protein
LYCAGVATVFVYDFVLMRYYLELTFSRVCW